MSGKLAPSDLQSLVGTRLGPYNSFNAVSRVQIWQWCTAMGDKNPLYLNDEYRSAAGYDAVVAPAAMMQMWTMRNVHMEEAAGSTNDRPFQAFDLLIEHGIEGNVAVSYDITFHRLLEEGDRAHHYKTIVNISDLKKTALGEGYFVTDRVEFVDQNEALFAEALITYFQYQPAESASTQPSEEASPPTPAPTASWQSDFTDISFAELAEGQALPELVIPITHKLIVSGAAATQDFIDVHHNAPAARAAAMPDIFMNILTTCGLCGRYLSDWAGPASRLKKLSLKLLAPNTPGDTMVMQGQVSKLDRKSDESLVSLEFAGKNNIGYHVTGAATLSVND